MSGRKDKRRRSHGVALVVVLTALSLLFASINLPAHDSPEHEVEAITAQMASGKSASLLAKRANEYRVLGKLAEAAADLNEALKLEPALAAVQMELSRVYLAQGKTSEALRAINRALALEPDDQERAPFSMVRADIYVARGEDVQALTDCEHAFKFPVTELDWYLTRSQIQTRLGQLDACVAGLRQGYEQTRSVVLQVEWVEALIDAGQYEVALEHIEPELRDSRWQSSWLLRRARARLGLDDEARAKDDLRKAIAELNRRINPRNPDLTLLADRGLARALLGQSAAAQKDLAAAKKMGADESTTRRLERTLAAPAQAPARVSQPAEKPAP